MKKHTKILFLIILIISLAYAVSVSAAPINGLEQTLTQPNGTEITVYFYGDEIYSYMTDNEGNVIVHNPETGYYVYASLVDGEITATNQAVGVESSGNTRSGEISFLKAEDIPQIVFISAYENSEFYVDPNTPELMSLDYEEDSKSFNGMNINNIVIFIDFKDKTYEETNLSFYDGMFNNNEDSLKSYYNETTYGNLGITSTFYPTSTSSTILTYRDENSSNYYEARYKAKNMFLRALQYVENQIPDCLDLDKNNDGQVDMITFVLPGCVVSGSDSVFWPHCWWFEPLNGVTIKGLNVNKYNVQIEGAISNWSSSTAQRGSAILAHETYHILGFPDMYYYDNKWEDSNIPLGEWDIMCASNGGHTPAYMKCQYGGWIDIPEIKENGTYTLNSLQDGGTCAYKLRSPYSTNEYFIVEYRKKTGNFEKNIPRTGIVIYRVLADKYKKGNSASGAPNGTADELRYLTDMTAGEYSPTLSSGEASGIILSSISVIEDETTASFTVSFADKKYLKYFKDKNLADAVITSIGKAESQITTEDLQELTALTINSNIYEQNYDLTGIEYLTGLQTLYLQNCKIDDISALAGLSNLTTLLLDNNHIADISALSNLTNLKVLWLRGNYIDDYSPVSSYYNNLSLKDFSLTDKDDAVFYVTELTDGVIESAYIKLTETRSTDLYYSLEKYDSSTNELLSRYRGGISVPKSLSVKSVTVSENICDTENTYVKLKVYEGKNYRHLMSETIIDESVLNIIDLN